MEWKAHVMLFVLLVVLLLPQCKEGKVNQSFHPGFDIWYGKEQSFGFPGNPQRAINVLGNVSYRDSLVLLEYSLNGGEWQHLSEGADGRRLARQGDFNVEILREELKEGKNTIQIRMEDARGNIAREEVIVNYTNSNTWPLPYEVDWKKVDDIQRVACITDGKWVLVENGIRTAEPYYDRILAFGDSTWRDFEIETSVIFHNFTLPVHGPPTFNVSHTALARPSLSGMKNEP